MLCPQAFRSCVCLMLLSLPRFLWADFHLMLRPSPSWMFLGLCGLQGPNFLSVLGYMMLIRNPLILFLFAHFVLLLLYFLIFVWHGLGLILSLGRLVFSPSLVSSGWYRVYFWTTHLRKMACFFFHILHWACSTVQWLMVRERKSLLHSYTVLFLSLFVVLVVFALCCCGRGCLRMLLLGNSSLGLMSVISPFRFLVLVPWTVRSLALGRACVPPKGAPFVLCCCWFSL